MGELPPGIDLDNLDELLASLPPSLAGALGIGEADLGGSRAPPRARALASEPARLILGVACAAAAPAATTMRAPSMHAPPPAPLQRRRRWTCAPSPRGSWRRSSAAAWRSACRSA